MAGALGTGVRYLVGLWADERIGSAFPYGTVLVNIVGCFLISVTMQAALTVAAISLTLRLALTTGFLGGLTTYSSFNHETMKLLETGSRIAALTNFCVTTVGCLLAGLIGLAIGRRLFGA